MDGQTPEQAIRLISAARVDAYYLDRSLTPAESRRRFSEDGCGREAAEERHYVVAIRSSGRLGWVFRFARYEETTLRSIVRTLNRLGVERLPLPSASSCRFNTP